MTLLEIITRAAGAEANVEKVFHDIMEKFPDTAPQLEPILAKFGADVAPANLAALGAAIPGELLNIGSGKIEPRDHAGDAI